ncbi:MAG: recombinase family protein [Deltaproteobacteria bacterium]
MTADGQAQGTIAGVKTIKEMADNFAKRVKPTIKALKSQNVSLQKIASELNKLNVQTARGKQWTATAVKNVLARV